MENYPDFEKLVLCHVNQHGLQRFIVKISKVIRGNDRSHILSSGSNVIPMFSTFSQNLALQKAFETAAQIKGELKRTAFDDAFCKKKFKLLIDRFSSFFC